jgi:hypothetical protein
MADHRIQVLFERHHLVLFRALRRMTGDAALAEDLVQDTFARALRAAANGTGSEERPSDAFYARMQGLLAPSTPRRRPWRPLAAAAAILLAALAGFASRPLLDSEHPPATVVETREPRDEPPASGSAAPMEAPPEPTRVVHFRRGVDWQR